MPAGQVLRENEHAAEPFTLYKFVLQGKQAEALCAPKAALLEPAAQGRQELGGLAYVPVGQVLNV